jgi:pimeloyl-ACP methyl ester carboxylesterase
MTRGAGGVAYAMICGSGSAGHVWEPVARALDGIVLPVPLEHDVPAMAAVLRPEVEALARPRVVIGTSLGALIALELARDVALDALILMSSGFGITVNPSVLDAIAANARGMLEQMARGVIADRGNQATVEAVTRDFEARGPEVLLRHMRVLARHRPQTLPDLPPTFVLWGAQDPGVSLADHAELALRCRAPLLPIGDAGHVPHLEQPEATLAWIRKAVRWAGL